MILSLERGKIESCLTAPIKSNNTLPLPVSDLSQSTRGLDVVNDGPPSATVVPWADRNLPTRLIRYCSDRKHCMVLSICGSVSIGPI